jgi:hypothetical protein
MPELPEVETVARDLRPRLVGATIVGARVSWARTLRTHDPVAFADAIAGREVLAVGRRAKQLVIDLSGSAALTIHLKMTGQLFVVPADVPEDPYVRLVLELADGRELRFRDIRKFGKVGLYGRDPGSGELVNEVGGAARLRGHRAGAVGRRVHGPRVPTAAATPDRPAQAVAPRPVVRRRDRQHLRRRVAVAVEAASAPDGRHAATARRAPPVRGDPRRPRRGGGAARLLDRRLHSPRRRWLDAGGPRRLPADRRALPALRSAHQADRGRARGRPTSARGVSASRLRTGRGPRPSSGR